MNDTLKTYLFRCLERRISVFIIFTIIFIFIIIIVTIYIITITTFVISTCDSEKNLCKGTVCVCVCVRVCVCLRLIFAAFYGVSHPIFPCQANMYEIYRSVCLPLPLCLLIGWTLLLWFATTEKSCAAAKHSRGWVTRWGHTHRLLWLRVRVKRFCVQYMWCVDFWLSILCDDHEIPHLVLWFNVFFFTVLPLDGDVTLDPDMWV